MFCAINTTQTRCRGRSGVAFRIKCEWNVCRRHQSGKLVQTDSNYFAAHVVQNFLARNRQNQKRTGGAGTVDLGAPDAATLQVEVDVQVVSSSQPIKTALDICSGNQNVNFLILIVRSFCVATTVECI